MAEAEILKEYEGILNKANKYEDNRNRDELVAQSTYWYKGGWEVFKNSVLTFIPISLKEKIVVDFGCKYGHAFPLFFAAGASKVIGLDALDRLLDGGRYIYSDYGERVQFARCDDGFVPLQPEMVDLVILNEVISHINPTILPRIYSEIGRILKVGGMVFISDYNNYRNQSYGLELIDIYDSIENGPDGKLWQGNPIYSFVTQRKNLIRKLCPDIEADKLEFLAKNTSGLYGDWLIREIERYQQTGELICRPYRRGISPTYPDSGIVEERAFYPEQIEYDLREYGFDCTILSGSTEPLVVGNRYPLNKWEIIQETGYPGKNAFRLPIPKECSDEKDRNCILLENNLPLQYSSSGHAEIAEKGLGRYSIWFNNGTIYFSASDNSDPRKNKMKYELFVSDRTNKTSYPDTASPIQIYGLKKY
jgi:SAM-dependent methyltransferase